MISLSRSAGIITFRHTAEVRRDGKSAEAVINQGT